MKTISLGSKKENAKEIKIKLTPLKSFLILVCLILFTVLTTNYMVDYVKDNTDRYKIQCINGSFEVVEPYKEYYCGEHYTNLKGKLESYNDLERYILGLENEK